MQQQDTRLQKIPKGLTGAHWPILRCRGRSRRTSLAMSTFVMGQLCVMPRISKAVMELRDWTEGRGSSQLRPGVDVRTRFGIPNGRMDPTVRVSFLLSCDEGYGRPGDLPRCIRLVPPWRMTSLAKSPEQKRNAIAQRRGLGGAGEDGVADFPSN